MRSTLSVFCGFSACLEINCQAVKTSVKESKTNNKSTKSDYRMFILQTKQKEILLRPFSARES
jgi:hypothetical protein